MTTLPDLTPNAENLLVPLAEGETVRQVAKSWRRCTACSAPVGPYVKHGLCGTCTFKQRVPAILNNRTPAGDTASAPPAGSPTTESRPRHGVMAGRRKRQSGAARKLRAK